MRFFKEVPIMKIVHSIILLAFATLLSSSCVSRTTISKDGYGGNKEEKSVVWIWQKEYRK